MNMIDLGPEDVQATSKGITRCIMPSDARFVDMTGWEFDRLKVESFYGRRGRMKFWRCRCKCGSLQVYSGGDLRMGDSTSCGCKRLDLRTKESEIPPAPEGVRHIPLTQGKYMVIDADDFERVNQFVWCWDGKYATRNTPTSMQRVHRFIMNEPEGLEVDHWDKDTTNNRKSNLRVATRGQNGCNRGIHKNNTSGFKGVTLDRKTGKWISRIVKDRKSKHLGTFSSPVEAHEAYKVAALEIHGEFASLT